MRTYFNLLFFLTYLLIMGCAGSRVVPINESFINLAYDFREYTQKGFMFTPEKYLGEYESIGLIEIIYVPEFREANDSEYKVAKQRRGSPRSVERVEIEAVDADRYIAYPDPRTNILRMWLVSRPNTNKLINNAFETATEMGANAITNFQIISTDFENNGLVVQTVKLTGFAIKRTD